MSGAYLTIALKWKTIFETETVKTLKKIISCDSSCKIERCKNLKEKRFENNTCSIQFCHGGQSTSFYSFDR